MKKLILFFAMVSAIMLGFAPRNVSAQFQPQPVVIKTTVEEGSDSLALSVLFTLFDGNGRPIPKDAVKSFEGGQIQLPTSPAVAATIEAATMPIKIGLVIDASGSMTQRIVPTKEAAIRFVNAAPANSQIAIFKFSEDLEKIQDFTGRDGLPAIESSIRSIQTRAPGDGDTCVYKAAFEAINAIAATGNENTQVRQTVVLFTDGIDRENGGKNCGESQADDVVSKANAIRPLPVQVHTIGLCGPNGCGNVNAPGLKTLADETFGSTAVGAVAELDTLFGTILAALNNQWIAKADVLAVKGINNATVSTKATINESQVALSFPSGEFFSRIDYGKQAKVEVPKRTYDAETNEYTVLLNVPSPDLVSKITLNVRDVSGGNTVAEQTIDQISTSMALKQPAAGLKQGREYCFDIRALNTEGTEILYADGKTVLSLCGKHEPLSPAPINFEFALPPDINWDQETLEIKLDKIQTDKNVSLLYEGAITEGNRPIMNIRRGVLGDDSLIQVRLPDAELRGIRESEQPKVLTIVLTLIDQVEQQTVEKRIETQPQRPIQPGLLTILLARVRNPIVLSSIAVIFMVVAGVLVAASLRSRKRPILEPARIYTGRTEFLDQHQHLVPDAVPPVADGATEVEAVQQSPAIKVIIVTTPVPLSNLDREIKRFPCVIGRENSAFLINGDAKVSRQHAQIDVVGKKIMVKDLDSANGTAFVVRDPASTTGTFIEQKRIGKGDSAEWDNQSLIRLGPNTVLELKPVGPLKENAPRTVIQDDFDNRTQILG